jgi:hypothetical protein
LHYIYCDLSQCHILSVIQENEILKNVIRLSIQKRDALFQNALLRKTLKNKYDFCALFNITNHSNYVLVLLNPPTFSDTLVPMVENSGDTRIHLHFLTSLKNSGDTRIHLHFLASLKNSGDTRIHLHFLTSLKNSGDTRIHLHFLTSIENSGDTRITKKKYGVILL